MTENELIGKIKQLKQIKPEKDWVFLAKSRILNQDSQCNESQCAIFNSLFCWKQVLFSHWKPALSTVTVSLILFGVLGYVVKNSLPGDALHSIKKAVERSQAVFVPEDEKTAFQIGLASERLEELAQIAEANQVEKLAPAISEVQASFIQVSQNLKKIREPEKVAQSIVEKTQKLKGTKQEIEKVLATRIVSEETEEKFEQALLPLYKAVHRVEAEALIEDLKGRALTEEKQEILLQMEVLSEQGKYQQAIELWLINQ